MTSTSAMHQRTATQPLDFAALTERCLGRVGLALRVLEKFVEQMDGDIAQLEEAIAARDHHEVGRLAHLIRGSSLSVSATQLAECSYELECVATSFAKDKSTSGAQAWLALENLITELRMAYSRVSQTVHETNKGAHLDE